jgi:hypothetical protein
MTKLALFVRLEAKPGQEAALADFRRPPGFEWHSDLESNPESEGDWT